jgi:hypothetical protein
MRRARGWHEYRALLSFVACVGLCGSVFATENAATNESQRVETHTLPERWCRNGAFLDAIKLMNAASRSLESLQRTDAAIAKAELGAVLAIAIKQASDEYHCVRGTLVAGYDASYAATVKRAMANAQLLKLSPDTVRVATELIATIEATGAPTSAKK